MQAKSSVSDRFAVWMGIALGIVAVGIVALSLAIILDVPDGKGIRPLHVALAMMFTTPLGLAGSVLATFGFRDRGSRGAAVFGVLLGLCPLPLTIIGLRIIVWYKDLSLLP
jgi:hypothetical protein